MLIATETSMIALTRNAVLLWRFQKESRLDVGHIKPSQQKLIAFHVDDKTVNSTRDNEDERLGLVRKMQRKNLILFVLVLNEVFF